MLTLDSDELQLAEGSRIRVAIADYAEFCRFCGILPIMLNFVIILNFANMLDFYKRKVLFLQKKPIEMMVV